MYSGARRVELCSLKVEHVHGEYFEIVEAKTAAGVRQVPIHDALAPTMKRLVEASKDGFVPSGLRSDKHGNRSDGIGRRFGKLKTELGFGDRHVFHSIRGTVITMLERAEVQDLWRCALWRRSQRASLNWEKFSRLVDRFFPPIRILHPLPCHRFDARTRGRSPVR
jgi:integrase